MYKNFNPSDKILIIDFGLGNFGSLINALEFLNFRTEIITNYKELDIKKNFKGCILPGVGAFDNGMYSLRERFLDKAIYEIAESGLKILGICLGMQMLLESSQESESKCPGLGLIKGKVELLDNSFAPVPNIGWNKTHSIKKTTNKFLDFDILDGDFYYIHSYYAKTLYENDSVAFFKHGNQKKTSVILKDNIMGVQFHPEKSQIAGLKLLRKYFGL